MPEAVVEPAQTASVLSRTLATAYDVGGNRRGALSGAGWLYGLPRLAYRSVLCVGAPSSATLMTLVRSADLVVLVVRSKRRRRQLETRARSEAWAGVQVVADMPETGAAEQFDLIVSYVRRGGLVIQVDPSSQAATTSDEPSLTLALTPRLGEVRSAVPSQDQDMRDAIERLGLAGTIASRPRLAAIERRLRRSIRISWPGPARTATIVGPSVLANGGVPAYISDAAAAAGRDLDRWGWAVAARGDYDSQKVLVLLKPGDERAPTGVVKVTRSTEHASRLENEHAALVRLESLPAAAGRVPRPWFAGRHAGRFLLGESLLDGVPFESRATWRQDCSHLDDALEWLTAYGAATRREVRAEAVAEALLTLVDRYAAIYRSSDEEIGTLRRTFERLGGLGPSLPVVNQHGDPGIWNLLVDPAGRTMFLDWEAAETDGLPLWDLLYLFRSYAVAASRRSGVRDRLDGAARHMLEDSPLADRLVRAVGAYRNSVGLPVEAIEPLLYGCWVHRSIKESTRLQAGRVHDGFSVRLIRRMLDRPRAPTLARLVEGGS